MDRYVEQLVEDIISKSKPIKAPETWEEVDIEDALDEFTEYSEEEYERQQDNADEELEIHFQEIEKYVAGEGFLTVAELTGLKNELFPPEDKLNDIQKNNIVAAMEKMLMTYHIQYNFPDELPAQIKYKLILESLEKEVFVCTIGYTSIDFCADDFEDCGYGIYHCKCANADYSIPELTMDDVLKGAFEEYGISDSEDQENENLDNDDIELPF